MAINKKLIHFKKYSDFIGSSGTNGTTLPTNGYYHNIPENAIVFILDTKLIWTHGHLYDGSTFDPSNIEASIQNILDTKLDNISDLDTIRSGAALGATALQALDLNNYALSVSGQINNINSSMNSVSSEVSNIKRIAEDARTKAANNESAISQCATKHELNTAVANLVDSAPETLNTLNELATAITEHQNVTDALDAAITNKADKTEIPTKVSLLENDSNYIQDGVPDGIYAVDADGKLIDYNLADSTALGVALVAGEHKFMIAKSDATDGTNTTLYWDKSYSDLSLTNYNTVDGVNTTGYLPKPDGTFGGSTHLSDDFTTWTNGALSDFNGKDNTAVIAAASSYARDMCTVLNTFNASDSHNDWYVPALGQLALIYLNKTEINAALTKIGGTALAAETYWSSSENSSDYAWRVVFDCDLVSYGYKDNYYLVRFVRDISTPTLKERVSELESNKQDKLVSGTNIKTINGTSILGSGNIVIEGGSSGGGAYAEVSHGTGDTTFTLTPNTFHVWEEVASLDLSFADEQVGVANEYLFQFTSGATATTLTLPDVKWANDTAPTIAENMIYQVSVLKGLASVLEFSNKAELIENKITLTDEINGILILEYPAASELVVTMRGDMTTKVIIPKNATTASADYAADIDPYYIAAITPNADDTFIYTFLT